MPPGSGRSNSQTKVAGSTQRPAPPTSHVIFIGALPRPSGAIGSEKRRVKRVMSLPSVPAAAVRTVGELAADAVIEARTKREIKSRASQPPMTRHSGKYADNASGPQARLAVKRDIFTTS